MGKTLVAYFSASGNTKKKAEIIAEGLGADLYEIVPEKLYTKEDLNWMDKKSRSSIEMSDKKFRPQLADKNANVAAYDRIIIGFPIWWGQAPRIIDAFLESYDFSGKTIIPFCTSASSDIGSSDNELHEKVDDTVTWVEGKRFAVGTSKDTLVEWLEQVSNF